MATIKFKKWVSGLSTERKKAIANGAGTSVAMLYQLASGHRGASNQLAGAIEAVSGSEIDRGDINATCRDCFYFKRCKALEKT